MQKNKTSPDGLILLYDVTSRQSFLSLSAVHKLLIETPGLQDKVPVAVIANKADLPDYKWEVSAAEGERFARRLGASSFDRLTTGAAAEGESTPRATGSVDQVLWNAIRGPAEWRMRPEVEAGTDREARLGEAIARLVEMAPRRGNKVQNALYRISKMGGKATHVGAQANARGEACRSPRRDHPPLAA